MFSIPEVKKVEEVMDKEFTTISEDMLIEDVIKEMIKSNTKTLMVTDENGELKGIISMTDIHKLYKDQELYNQQKVKDIMQKDIIYSNKGLTLDECRDIMINENIGILPILDGGKIAGVLKQEHIRDYLYMNLEDYGITLKYIIGQIKEGICAINNEGIVILWNKFMEDRYEIKSEDMTGRHISEFLENTISEKVLNSRVGMSDIYFTDKKKDLYALVHANPIFYKDEFIGVVCTEVDVTEARKLSMELDKANDALKYLKDEVKNLSKGSFDKILGQSYKLEKSKSIAKQVARTNSSIFIWGESGTGKEVFARAIHDYSERKGQFIPVNCSAIPSELFESEFFGYESGAFTGASKKGRVGIFELAKDGTVFLDEIADLPLSMQAKLLRVLQEKEIRRVGGDTIIKINPRIISATNKDLAQLVKEEKFREDLYYRLNVVEIKIPPLRERKEDIVILVHKFLEEICKQNNKKVLSIDKDVINVFQNYRWKGNIRELRNTIENIVVLSQKDTIEMDDIPSYMIEYANNNIEEEDYPLDLTKATQRLEIKNITKALTMSKGNKAKAAKILNIPRTTLYYKIDQYNIDVSKK
ncbi:sigma-54 dependent transcriptional regulator PrdR [Asaccharospora irregularis]|uniref:Transcriptional regulator containing PAS, AAA-type ATPase, and DNA-binding Fis domains n=1 Tax=Asaccharospora irregularis DSM 2635 TaxID=1121321 RepID=A0A1M5RXR7_9FIRM|nr:sigma-54 dependent transcriptional regulator PrdR [Asaccharospora irregularis]SHH31035.1 Transcriptional regulator containing PAS, AAA-type ATPase, and DNA-binding Fis domains [Asaccharospora irregularis DSM 2635]